MVFERSADIMMNVCVYQSVCTCLYVCAAKC